MTPARTLQTALRAYQALIRQDEAGSRPSDPTVRGALANLRRAWAACPDAEAVYARTRAADRQETGWWAEPGRADSARAGR